jgi:hypothetical protein
MTDDVTMLRRWVPVWSGVAVVILTMAGLAVYLVAVSPGKASWAAIAGFAAGGLAGLGLAAYGLWAGPNHNVTKIRIRSSDDSV